MKEISIFIFKVISRGVYEIVVLISKLYNYFSVYTNRIKHGDNFRINGFVRFIVNKNGVVQIGDNFRLNSGSLFNPIGRNQRSLFVVTKNAQLKVGNNVGMSSVAIVCHLQITIGNNIKIGGNTVFYDTDFHALNYIERTSSPELKKNVKVRPVYIHDNVFIGGHSLILKGTVIGKNSIIGAGSVVSGKIPPNEVWAGNPAKFIKRIDAE